MWYQQYSKTCIWLILQSCFGQPFSSIRAQTAKQWACLANNLKDLKRACQFRMGFRTREARARAYWRFSLIHESYNISSEIDTYLQTSLGPLAQLFIRDTEAVSMSVTVHKLIHEPHLQMIYLFHLHLTLGSAIFIMSLGNTSGTPPTLVLTTCRLHRNEEKDRWRLHNTWAYFTASMHRYTQWQVQENV